MWFDKYIGAEVRRIEDGKTGLITKKTDTEFVEVRIGGENTSCVKQNFLSKYQFLDPKLQESFIEDLGEDDKITLKTEVDIAMKANGNKEITHRNTFVVFQNLAAEYTPEEDRYLIAPKVAQDGLPRHFWKRVTDVRIGDAILHITKNYIVAISFAKSEAYIVERNGVEHYKVDCKYVRLDNQVSLKKFRKQIIDACKNRKYAPFNREGNANQGYLYFLPEPLILPFVEEVIKLNPDLTLPLPKPEPPPLGGPTPVVDRDDPNENEKEEEGNPLNIILYGPPGTGKTYNSKIYAVTYCNSKDVEEVNQKVKDANYDEVLEEYETLENEGRIKFTTFHQSYGYEEFIEGIKPDIMASDSDADSGGNIYYKVESGVFKKFCEEAAENKEKPYVFIIDEINRGNISKIFGELITLIEENKRAGRKEAMSCILPYSQTEFSVPSNVYIIGTMNTADRSIALMDTALRRRFNFIEMLPDTNVLPVRTVQGIDIVEMLNTINQRIEVLYNREHAIGHSFFMELDESSDIKDLAAIFKNKIIPLLQEYFYEDYEKIRLVLGDSGKSKEDYQFIKRIQNVKLYIFNGGVPFDIPEFRYEINEDAFFEKESYIQIKQQS